jgi:hypothetical protein
VAMPLEEGNTCYPFLMVQLQLKRLIPFNKIMNIKFICTCDVIILFIALFITLSYPVNIFIKLSCPNAFRLGV